VSAHQECFHNSRSIVDEAMDAEAFHDWLDSIEDLDINKPEVEEFQIIILSDHTYIVSNTMWDLLTIAKTN
jgi:hypothetical protein